MSTNSVMIGGNYAILSRADGSHGPYHRSNGGNYRYDHDGKIHMNIVVALEEKAHRTWCSECQVYFGTDDGSDINLDKIRREFNKMLCE